MWVCDAAIDCSGHGTTTDLDSTDGCDCECNPLYNALGNCAVRNRGKILRFKIKVVLSWYLTMLF